jgi:hypothetical protein
MLVKMNVAPIDFAKAIDRIEDILHSGNDNASIATGWFFAV